MSEPFVLDLEENPHPKMREAALLIRANARVADERLGPLKTYDVDWRLAWKFYLRAMADATGCEESELEEWLDRHEAST